MISYMSCYAYEKMIQWIIFELKATEGIRTPDPLHAMEMRYQLRHSPVELAGFEPATLCLQSRCATSCAIAP